MFSRFSRWLDQNFFFNKTCRYLPFTKKLRWLLYKWGRYLIFWTLEKKQKKQELQEVSNWDILKLRSQMKLASKMHQYILYIYPSSIFVFYEILRISNFFCRTSPRCCSWIYFHKREIDKYCWKIFLRWFRILNLNFNVPCWTSPRFSWLLDLNFFFYKICR